MFRRVKGYLLNCESRYEGVNWFMLVALSIPPLNTGIALLASTSYVSGHLRATMKRRSEQDE
jgi:hypothetical protein